MLFYKTFYINAMRFLKGVFLMILKIIIVIFFLMNALISVFFILLSLNLIIIRFFTCFYLRFVSSPLRYSFLTSFLISPSSLLSYFSRLLIIVSIIIYLRFSNAF